MKNDLKPLLEDKEEELAVLQEKVQKEHNNAKEILGTVIASMLVFFICANFLYGYYLGFKYFDVRYENKEPKEVVDETNCVFDTGNDKNNKELKELCKKKS